MASLSCSRRSGCAAPSLRAESFRRSVQGSSLPVFRRIFADIGDRQSIAASLSTFSAHVAVLRRILDHADDRTLVLLDEIGSGTDPAEGAALAGAVLLSLTRRGTITLATTHLGALKELASRAPGVVNASLQFDSATLQPSYHFQKGVPGRSYGLAIARRLGLPESVLTEAEQQIPDAERNLDALLASVEERQREQDPARGGSRGPGISGRGAAYPAQSLRLRPREPARPSSSVRRRRPSAPLGSNHAACYLRRGNESRKHSPRPAKQETRPRPARRGAWWRKRPSGRQRRIERLGGSAARRLGSEDTEFESGTRVRLDSGTVGTVIEQRTDGKTVVQVGSLKLVSRSGSLVALEPSRRAATSHAARRPPSHRAAERKRRPSRSTSAVSLVRKPSRRSSRPRRCRARRASLPSDHSWQGDRRGPGSGTEGGCPRPASPKACFRAGQPGRHRSHRSGIRELTVIPDEIIEQIRESADIVGLIGESTELKRTGSDYRGPCPFHGGTHRNFAVIPKKGRFYCFVCKGVGRRLLLSHETLRDGLSHGGA